MATTLNNALSTQERLLRAHDAASRTAKLSTAEKNSLLENMAQAIESEQRSILSANQADLDESGIEGALRDRLLLTPQRIAEMAQMLLDVAKEEIGAPRFLAARSLRNGPAPMACASAKCVFPWA